MSFIASPAPKGFRFGAASDPVPLLCPPMAEQGIGNDDQHALSRFSACNSNRSAVLSNEAPDPIKIRIRSRVALRFQRLMLIRIESEL